METALGGLKKKKQDGKNLSVGTKFPWKLKQILSLTKEPQT